MAPYLKLEDPQGSRTEEPGPFARLLIDETGFMVDQDDYPAIVWDPSTSLWKIVDGEAIGRPELTGTTWPIVWGQSK